MAGIERYPRAPRQPGGPRHAKHKKVEGRPCNNNCGRQSANWGNYYLCHECVRALRQRLKRRLEQRMSLNPPHVRGCMECKRPFVSIGSSNRCETCIRLLVDVYMDAKRARYPWRPHVAPRKNEIATFLTNDYRKRHGGEPRTMRPKLPVRDVLAERKAWDDYYREEATCAKR